jgi:hypothetical protein
MRYRSGISQLAWVMLLATSVTPAHAQLTGGADHNTSVKSGHDSECAIAKNPSNHAQLFVLCNTATAGLFAARSTDMGVTWTFPDATDKTIADGDANQGPLACCDPNLAWDTFGNLFLTYLSPNGADVVTIVSTDGGLTFTNLASFAGSVDQPSVVAVNTTAPGAPVALWIVWNQAGAMVARGAAVTGLGVANIGAFNALQNIPGTNSCSFGDVAVSPAGVVVQTCGTPVPGEGPSNILVNIDADGLGPGNFGAAITATTTNVGGFDFIPPQATRSIDPEAGLAYDNNAASPHVGRLYLVYTEETVAENNDTDIMLRWSDNDGATWSAPIRVNDDATTRSQFLPKIAVNPLSGNVGVCWHDARNSATNTAVEIFCSIATRLPATPAFMANVRISDAASTSNGGGGMDFGDYSGLAYFQGRLHPIWAGLTATTAFDAFTDAVLGGPAASEGDPHMRTVSGVHFDFQAAGDFVALRDGDGMEIQLRHHPVATTFTPGPDGYSGIATGVSVNTAVAARVGTRRVSFQPGIAGSPDPASLQLRVDGTLTTLGPNGLDLGGGGRVVKSGAGDGIEIEFPNGTTLVITPGFWSSQNTWYLNVNVYNTPAMEGVMGAILPGNWLPLLPDGTSLGQRPAAVPDRYTALYGTFAEAWRVKPANSLFDNISGMPQPCTPAGWPRTSGSCVSAQSPAATAIPAATVNQLCAPIRAKGRQTNCRFDLRATGDRGFARTYLLSERIEQASTTTIISAPADSSRPGKPITFAVTVLRKFSRGRAPTGQVQFLLNGEGVGELVALDAQGRALWKSPILRAGTYRIAAIYRPGRATGLLASSSAEVRHIIGGPQVR